MGMPGEAFYATVAKLPPLGVPVRIFWGGRGPFEATRITKAWLKSRGLKVPRGIAADEHVWVVVTDDGDTLYLPDPRAPRDRDRGWIGWHTLGVDRETGEFFDPEFWAPPLGKADAWRAASVFPEPAFYHDPAAPARMWHEAASFDAATAAAEMEADRETARVSREKTQAVYDGIAEQWWRDETKIKFGQSPDTLTLKDCEGRLMRCLAISSSGGFAEGLDSGLDVETASMVGDGLMALAAETSEYVRNDVPVPLQPSPKDGGENYLQCMAWFLELGKVHDRPDWSVNGFSRRQRILVWRAAANPLSYDEIGQRLAGRKDDDISGNRVQELFTSAIETAWRVGAGLIVTNAQSRINEIRKRNRDFKRNQGEMVV